MSLAALRYVAAVLDDDRCRLTTAERLVLYVYADTAGSTGETWPSAATVGRRAGVHPNTVRRIRARLVAAGHLALVTPSRGGEHRSTTRLRFPVQAFVELSPPRAPRRGVAGADPAPPGALPRAPRRGDPAPPGAPIHRDEPLIEPRDDTPAAFTDADTARAWTQARFG